MWLTPWHIFSIFLNQFSIQKIIIQLGSEPGLNRVQNRVLTVRTGFRTRFEPGSEPGWNPQYARCTTINRFSAARMRVYRF